MIVLEPGPPAGWDWPLDLPGRGSLVVVGIDEQPGVGASCALDEPAPRAPDHHLS